MLASIQSFSRFLFYFGVGEISEDVTTLYGNMHIYNKWQHAYLPYTSKCIYFSLSFFLGEGVSSQRGLVSRLVLRSGLRSDSTRCHDVTRELTQKLADFEYCFLYPQCKCQKFRWEPLFLSMMLSMM